MNRPSYWMLLFLVAASAALWWTHSLRGREGEPVGADTAGATAGRQWAPEPEPRVVSLQPATERTPVLPEAVLSGQVLDPRGMPIPQAKVRVRDCRGAASSDREGRFDVPVLGAGPFRVEVAAEGFRRARAAVARTDVPAILVLEPALPWQPEPAAEPLGQLAGEGFLRDGDGGVIPYGIVTVRESGAMVRADENGRYVAPLPAGPATLVAHDGAGRVAVGEPFTSARKQGLVPLPDLVLRAGAAMRGRVLDAGGEPRAGAGVVLRGPGVLRRTVTNAAGGFAFEGLPLAELVVEALPWQGQLGVRRVVHAGAVANDLDLRLEPEQPLRVQVVDRAGAPQALVHVGATDAAERSAWTRADGEGRATLAGIGAGPWTFEVRQPGDFAVRQVVAFEREQGRLVVD